MCVSRVALCQGRSLQCVAFGALRMLLFANCVAVVALCANSCAHCGKLVAMFKLRCPECVTRVYCATCGANV